MYDKDDHAYRQLVSFDSHQGCGEHHFEEGNGSLSYDKQLISKNGVRGHCALGS